MRDEYSASSAEELSEIYAHSLSLRNVARGGGRADVVEFHEKHMKGVVSAAVHQGIWDDFLKNLDPDAREEATSFKDALDNSNESRSSERDVNLG